LLLFPDAKNEKRVSSGREEKLQIYLIPSHLGKQPSGNSINPNKLMEHLPRGFTRPEVKNSISIINVHRRILTAFKQNRKYLLFPLYQGETVIKG